MEASARLLLPRRLLHHHRRPLHSLKYNNPSIQKLRSSPRNGPRAFLSIPSPNPGKPFLSISSPVRALHQERLDRSDLERDLDSWPSDRDPDAVGGGDPGFCGGKAEAWTVVLLGWLGAEEKHLKRYAEMYRARGIRPVRFVVPMRETVGLDLCKNVEAKIDRLARELARWCEESERDGNERNLLFHTFSNTGWLAYGVLLQNFRSRNGVIAKIRGCIVDSAPSAEINPQVWAAGYCAALLKKRSVTLVESVESRKLDGRGDRWNVQDIIPALIEIIVFKVLEVFFSLALMLPYAKQRLGSIISTLKDQPPYPQLYLYSSADKVIPADIVERFIKEQKALGRSVYAHNFGSSPHVDHFRSFPHIYSAKVNEFLEHCCSTVVSKSSKA